MIRQTLDLLGDIIELEESRKQDLITQDPALAAGIQFRIDVLEQALEELEDIKNLY